MFLSLRRRCRLKIKKGRPRGITVAYLACKKGLGFTGWNCKAIVSMLPLNLEWYKEQIAKMKGVVGSRTLMLKWLFGIKVASRKDFSFKETRYRLK